MRIEGRVVLKLGDGISTDHIIPGRFFHLRSQPEELARHAFADLDPDFFQRARGGIVVGGSNFGLGSSREHAALVLKIAGVRAVLARSFARIFFRNAINQGIPAIACDAASLEVGEALELDLEGGRLRSLDRPLELVLPPFPPVMARILEAGGLVPFVQAHGDLSLP